MKKGSSGEGQGEAVLDQQLWNVCMCHGVWRSHRALHPYPQSVVTLSKQVEQVYSLTGTQRNTDLLQESEAFSTVYLGDTGAQSLAPQAS